MDSEVDDTGQDSSSISYMIDYVRNLLPGYSQENDEEECQEKVGNTLFWSFLFPFNCADRFVFYSLPVVAGCAVNHPERSERGAKI